VLLIGCEGAISDEPNYISDEPSFAGPCLPECHELAGRGCGCDLGLGCTTGCDCDWDCDEDPGPGEGEGEGGGEGEGEGGGEGEGEGGGEGEGEGGGEGEGEGPSPFPDVGGHPEVVDAGTGESKRDGGWGGDPCDGDQPADNRTPERAEALVRGLAVERTTCQGDDDWYGLPARKGSAVVARLARATSPLLVRLYESAPDGALRVQAETGEDGGVDVGVREAAADGTWLLRVRAQQAEATYTIEAR